MGDQNTFDSKIRNEDILSLFCEKNSDGTKHLRLKGNELQQRFGCRLEGKHMSDIAYFMVNHPEIVSADFCYNNFGDEGVKFLSNIYFGYENNLVELNIMNCDITAVGIETFSSSKYLNLKICRLNGNNIGPLGARFIARLIEQCSTLLYIDIAETDQTLESIECILIVIEHSTLIGLNISRVIPKSYFTKYNRNILAEDLSVVLELNKGLQELYVQKMEFDGHDIDIFINGLRVNKTLHLLNISCNKMGDYGAELLSKWLQTKPNLRGLNISSNSIGSYGARALSYGVPCSQLRYLNVARNCIEDWGLTDILDSIRKSHRMRIFLLWGNKIGPVTCRRIQRMLASGVLDQAYLDVQIYEVDGNLYAAQYSWNHFRKRYYCLLDHGCPSELRMKKHKIFPENSLPRELLYFQHYSRFPPVNPSLGLKLKKEKICPENEKNRLRHTNVLLSVQYIDKNKES